MFLLGVLGMVLFASVDTGFAILVKKFLDCAFVERDPRMLLYVPGGIIVLFLVRGIGDYLSVYAPGWVGRQVIKSLRHDLFARFLQLPVSFFVDPAMLDDPDTKDLQSITLSYTFFPRDDEAEPGPERPSS